eukprot:Awhi_evm1s6859
MNTIHHLLCVYFLVLSLVSTNACTDFVLWDGLPKDITVSARNMDYDLDMNSDVVKISRGTTVTSLDIA